MTTRELRNFVNGAYSDSRATERTPLIDPATEEVYGSTPVSTREDVAEEFADAESQDTGKPRATLVDDEILLSVDQIRFFAGAARNLEGRSAGEYLKDHTSFVRREPIGVVGQVTTWNYPLNMAVW